MEGFSRKAEIRPQLQDFIPKGRREWLVNQNESRNSEEQKLELRLGPPGEEDWAINKNNFGERDDSSLLSLGFFSNMAAQNTCGSSSPWLSSHHHQSLLPVMGKESLQQTSCTTKVGVDLQSAEKKAFSLASANNTAVPNTSQKRTAPAPVVGWPPIRSFRKNLASSSSSSKLSSEAEPQKLVPKKISNERQVERCPKGLFVKINMEGVPIGRKVDLKSYDSYEKLSCAVDELFRDLLAAQRDPNSAGKIQNNQEGEKAITGLLDGGEYTLVYEDNEGDRMLVGDVPWHMFVSTIKRLRVLKSSELPSLFLGSKQEKNPTIL